MTARSDPLAVLRVIRRLEVGPPQIEPRRLRVPYTVTRDGRDYTQELAYRWEEDVFDAGEPASRNLAAMVGAQLALNYGLFCEEIRFRGEFDAHDRRFVEEFARNTAREIYVNKLLMPNPFLEGPVSALPAVKRDDYVQARIEFPDSGEDAQVGASPWGADAGAHAILSSGGKDSLLSLGLLEELGLPAHPIFLNESGRHWYTALNAYRHLAQTRPATARVWTNSDRMFAWMLRHLPFVRQDFARLRSDEYPIRLWTVAVFLFGALPLLRRRGVGRLLIGDEFDTTTSRSFRGIRHYAGLYDQSRWFDEALTRYFHRKGWRVSQFSVLRPFSELLIEKLLVERYPELQQHQVSCHATHLEGERAHPCGQCEKCRRIVGMLVALGADPGACGYTPEQIEQCLAALPERGVHQERPAARHLAHLLREQGRIPADGGGKTFVAEPHPEVLSLRFHREQSPYDTIPDDLRPGLYRIFLEHADGAVERRGRLWVPCDPLDDAALSRPYRFGTPPTRADDGPDSAPSAGEAPEPRTYLLAEMTWKEARARLRKIDIALLPVGAIEQHGPHLPLDTDAFDADYLARRVAATCREPRPIVLPLIPYGVSYHHDDFAGTVSVSPDTLAGLVYDVGLSVARHGITKLVIVNGHGGNGPTLHLAAQMINRDAHIFTCVDTGETSDAEVYGMVETRNDVHAGEIETSTTLAIRPGLVQMDKAPRMVPRFSNRFLDFTSKQSVGWYAYTSRISQSGVLGDATRATREKGERIWDVMVRRLVELVEDLASLSLDEIHQRRY